MGVDKLVYLGPVLFCLSTKKPTKFHRTNSCPVCDTTLDKENIVDATPFSKNKFCSVCGTLLKDYDVTEIVVSKVDIHELTGDALADVFRETTPLKENEFVYMPNASRDQPREFCFNVDYDCQYVEWSEINPVDEMIWFKKQFAHEIGLIEEAYGEENVFVRWAFFNMFH